MSTYTPIASITLASAASSVTFSGIPQTYTDLVLVLAGGTDAASGWGLRFNSDTGSNYSRTYLTGTGSAASSGRDTNQTTADISFNGLLGNNTNYNSIVSIMNYSNTTTNKTALSRSNNAGTGVDTAVSLWRSTAAITSMEVRTTSAGRVFNSGSTFNLYGIANASITNVAKATGGDSVYTDGTYWYHIFRSSGTFTPTQALTADYLVVAGGGGGGKDNTSPRAGGGGAGGYRTSIGGSGLSLTAQAYTVTVGAGGVGSTSDTQSASVQNGSNSVFSSITASGGGGGGQGYSGGNNASSNNGATGGSGGGAGMGGGPGLSITGAAGNSGSYSPVEGYAGGNSSVFNSSFTSVAGAGGGGSSAVGGNGVTNSSSSQGGNGGAGTSNSITGASVTYAGGGGGQSVSGSALAGGGGSGGGGAGNNSGTGTAGTANTGGGGGAGHTGGAGGSGIVVIRYAA